VTDPARAHVPQQLPPDAAALPAPAPAAPAAARRSRSLRVLVWIGVFIALGGLELIVGGALLVGVAVMKAYGTMRERADVATTQRQLGAIAEALGDYRREVGVFPSTAEGLEALRRPPAGMADRSRWAGPYLSEAVTLDPWQRPYQYESPENSRRRRPGVWSLGPDGADGTDDDVVAPALAIPMEERP
jgi:general secretion pathway protein G